MRGLIKQRGSGTIRHETQAGAVFVAATHDPAEEGDSIWAVHWILRGPETVGAPSPIVAEGDFEFGGTNPDFPEPALVAGAMAAARAARNLLKMADLAVQRAMRAPGAVRDKKPIPARRRR